MKLYFVRHGETEHNLRKVCTGWIDSPLTNTGIEQAQATANNMKESFSIIYSSDLLRCKQTTEVINEKLQLPVTFDERLREENFGLLGGKSWTEINENVQPNMQDLGLAQEYDYKPFNGESVHDVSERLDTVLKEVAEKHVSKKVLIVVHGGVIRLLYKLYQNKLLRKIENASIHEIDIA